MRILISSLGLAACGLSGCGSLTTYQSADTLAPGAWQGMAVLGAGAYTDQPQQSKTPDLDVEIGARRGIAANTDVGLKLYTFGIEASVRQRVVTGVWSVAVLGALGGLKTGASYSSVPAAWLGQVRVGGVATRRTSSCFAWNLGPVVTATLWLPADGGHASGVMLGAFGGFDWRFGDQWHLIPELSLHRTLAGDTPVDGAAAMLGTALARDW